MRTEQIGIRLFAIAAALTLSGVMLNCSGDEQPMANGTPPAHETALLKPFKQDLMHALKTALDAGGPIEAMTACNIQAPGIAKANSTGDVKMGRSSHRLRNPDNAPNEWVAPFLESMVEKPATRIPMRIETGDGINRYIEPIFIQPICLPCHGEEISEDVSAILAELYPDDAATGFKAGEFRGLFWMEYIEE